MRRLKYGVRLIVELMRFSIVNHIWWPVPLVLLLMLVGTLMIATQVAAPFTVYTLF